jgi:hypothetical protein
VRDAIALFLDVASVAADLVQTAHLTVRDAWRVLELSRQRIIQLLEAASRKASAPVGAAFALVMSREVV